MYAIWCMHQDPWFFGGLFFFFFFGNDLDAFLLGCDLYCCTLLRGWGGEWEWAPPSCSSDLHWLLWFVCSRFHRSFLVSWDERAILASVLVGWHFPSIIVKVKTAEAGIFLLLLSTVEFAASSGGHNLLHLVANMQTHATGMVLIQIQALNLKPLVIIVQPLHPFF